MSVSYKLVDISSKNTKTYENLSDNRLLKFIQCQILLGNKTTKKRGQKKKVEYTPYEILKMIHEFEVIISSLSSNVINARIRENPYCRIVLGSEDNVSREFRIYKNETLKSTRLNAKLPNFIKVKRNPLFSKIRNIYRYDLIIKGKTYKKLAINEITCFLNIYYANDPETGFSNIDIINILNKQ